MCVHTQKHDMVNMWRSVKCIKDSLWDTSMCVSLRKENKALPLGLVWLRGSPRPNSPLLSRFSICSYGFWLACSLPMSACLPDVCLVLTEGVAPCCWTAQKAWRGEGVRHIFTEILTSVLQGINSLQLTQLIQITNKPSPSDMFPAFMDICCIRSFFIYLLFSAND